MCARSGQYIYFGFFNTTNYFFDWNSTQFYTAVLIFGSIVLIGSLVYYMIVFMAEVVGHVPGFVRALCANKRSLAHKKLEDNDGDNQRDSSFEMDQNPLVYGNDKRDLEAAEAATKHEQQYSKALENQLETGRKQQGGLLVRVCFCICIFCVVVCFSPVI